MEEILIAHRGRMIKSSCELIAGQTVVSTGRWLKIAAVRDEELVEGEVVPDPELFASSIKECGLHADIFTFAQAIDEPSPKYSFPFEWDNVAAANTTSYTGWWQKLPQETRKNVRRAAKKGLTVRIATFDDAFVAGIKAIYDETPVRQGTRFWHYGKDPETIRRENGTYRERCEYIGAYFEDVLVGFLRFVYVDRVARIMQILASLAHTDRRPMNALLAKGVEVCHERGIRCLIYSQFTFGNKKNSPLTEFKRRNGFEEVRFPRYFVPLTLKGRLAVQLRLHRGLIGLLPSPMIELLLRMRSFVVAQQLSRRKATKIGE
jgi:hypothetical protein